MFDSEKSADCVEAGADSRDRRDSRGTDIYLHFTIAS